MPKINGSVSTNGVVKVDGIIELPEYWGKLVPETIRVIVTPKGVWQELYVAEIQYGSKIIIKNAAGGPIDAYYNVYAVQEKPLSDI